MRKTQWRTFNATADRLGAICRAVYLGGGWNATGGIVSKGVARATCFAIGGDELGDSSLATSSPAEQNEWALDGVWALAPVRGQCGQWPGECSAED